MRTEAGHSMLTTRRAGYASSRSRRAATRPYEPTRSTMGSLSCSAAMPCYARVRG